MKQTCARILITLIILVVVGAVAIQFIRPSIIGRNPPVALEPTWQDPEARALAVRACFDCHSNETSWPWYSRVAPLSWLVARDIEVGRGVLNFSEWGTSRRGEAHEMGEAVLEGEMPPAIYLLMHPSARLTAAERDVLVRELSSLR
ncbi:MAG: hypothetical protein A2Z66_12195 [Chloroflexi bacterium RBG_13_66_10]|jgi:hypothetical protein|nr:MAG: hypothetical protein A2Z66_12195 [Chloroflexi bacterium RBG_13_66_10]